MCYIPPQSRPDTHPKEEPNTPGSPRDPTRGLNAQAHPNGPRAGPRHKLEHPPLAETGAISSTKGLV